MPLKKDTSYTIEEVFGDLSVGMEITTNGDGSGKTYHCVTGVVYEIGKSEKGDPCFYMLTNDAAGSEFRTFSEAQQKWRGYQYSWKVKFCSPGWIRILSIPSRLDKVNSCMPDVIHSVGSMMKRVLDKGLQTLVKAGYINGGLELTDKGRSALDSLLFETHKEALVKMAQEDIDEAKEVKCSK